MFEGNQKEESRTSSEGVGRWRAALRTKEKGEKGSCSLGDKFILSAIPKSCSLRERIPWILGIGWLAPKLEQQNILPGLLQAGSLPSPPLARSLLTQTSSRPTPTHAAAPCGSSLRVSEAPVTTKPSPGCFHYVSSSFCASVSLLPHPPKRGPYRPLRQQSSRKREDSSKLKGGES